MGVQLEADRGNPENKQWSSRDEFETCLGRILDLRQLNAAVFTWMADQGMRYYNWYRVKALLQHIDSKLTQTHYVVAPRKLSWKIFFLKGYTNVKNDSIHSIVFQKKNEGIYNDFI